MNITRKILSIFSIFTLSLSINSCSLPILKNKLSKSLKVFLVCIATFSINSCGSFPTNWAFVDKSEVDTLLKSPDTIEFEGKSYELSSYYKPEKRNTPRGGPFIHSELVEKSSIEFSLHEKNDYSIDSIDLSKKLKAISLWLIHKDYQYYFETTNFKLLEKVYYSLDPPFNYYPAFRNVEKKPDIVIVKFLSLSNNQTYFIKTHIY